MDCSLYLPLPSGGFISLFGLNGYVPLNRVYGFQGGSRQLQGLELKTVYTRLLFRVLLYISVELNCVPVGKKDDHLKNKKEILL